jgi:uncharacterized protein GlcG (DUF336 family)
VAVGIIIQLALWSIQACKKFPLFKPSSGIDSLNIADIKLLTTQAIEQATRLGVKAEISIVDRTGNILAVYRMTGAKNANVNPLFGSAARARTAAYLSSNQHAFSSLTACFITRAHFPPGVNNTPGGPLYGVVFSQLGGGDVQPNSGALPGIQPTGQPGLTGIPGGFPLYKNGRLVGGLGVAGGTLDVPNTLSTCTGASQDEQIALSALTGYEPNPAIVANTITIDGVSLAYTNTALLSQTYTFAVEGTLLTQGAFDPRYPPLPYKATTLPTASGYRTQPLAGVLLNAEEVASIIQNAAAKSARTRAQIRRPPSSPARVWIAVTDITGRVLAIWRDQDAATFGMDVSVQKARTAFAFSNPQNDFGVIFRKILRLDPMTKIAVSTRAIGYLAQDWYPPGIDLIAGAKAGPFWEGANFAWQQRLAAIPTLPAAGNGITIFPGGIPLYKTGMLAGAIGVSGDGVDQDDYIAAAGASGYEPPAGERSDNFFYDNVRLPYVKFPRSPDL